MADEKCCGANKDEQKETAYEIARIPKTKNVCTLCEDYAKAQAAKADSCYVL